uniref:Calcium binding protein 5b n=1 Tax=Scleropages formosus TaxID=113540 RepID=A0A8C9SVC7_SCLFO
MSLGPACIFLRGGKNIVELREAFQEFDKDKDGLISCKDLGNLMRTMGFMPTEMELIELSQNINMNLGGRVDFEDFVELMAPKLLAETAGMIGLKELKDAFKEFDMDGDGAITTEELRLAMNKLLGEQMSRREIDDVVREVDNNKDGTVDFEGEHRGHARSGASLGGPASGAFGPARCLEGGSSLRSVPQCARGTARARAGGSSWTRRHRGVSR